MNVQPMIRHNWLTNRNWKVRAVQAVNHILFFYALTLGWSPFLLGSVAVYFCMFCIGINVGAHRYFSHGSFRSGPAGEWFMGICMCLATLGSPLAWAGMHRMHHRFSDGPKDPHSPLSDRRVTWFSFLNAYIGFWGKYVAPARNTFDLRHRRIHKILHFNYFGIIGAYVLLLILIDPLYAIYFYCVPAVFAFHAASLIVTVGHTLGHRQHLTRDFSRNNVLLHWLTFGEGLHNLHHAYPNNYVYREVPWYYFDLPGFVIEHAFKKKSPESAAVFNG